MLPNDILLQGRYRIIEQIGRGGMGAVYRAIDTRLQATVALKQTMVEGEPLRKAFEREAQILASLHHPILPHVSDHFVEERGQFLVMEYIPGDDLGTLLQHRDRPFAVDDVFRWADQLLDALDYLHTRTPQIIHRDIKPQNLKLTDRNEVVLLDFGLAKGSSVQTRVTSTGSIFGYTPYYAPLEQIHGTGTDGRSDLYALAATLYHLLTTRTPIDAVTRAAAKVNDESDPLVPITELNPLVSPAVAAVLHQALQQRANQRPASAVAMRTLLREAIVLASRPPLTVPTIVHGSSADATVVHAPMARQSSTAPTTPFYEGAVSNENASGQTRAPGGRRRGIWFAVGVPMLLLGATAAAFALRAVNLAAVLPPTAQASSVAVVATALPPATSTPEPTLDVLKAAEATFTMQTTTAQAFANLVGTAGLQTATALAAASQTSLALTPSSTPAPTNAPTNTPEPTRAPTATPKTAPSANTPKPAPATNTPPPATHTPAPAVAPSGAILSTGNGELFRATVDIAQIAAEQGNGGSCIAGKVLSAEGSPFSGFGLQIDNRGNPREPNKNNETGTYRLCGLAAGEWGVAIYAAGGVDIPGSEQAAHQVRVRLSGTPGEIFYINFRATPGFKPLPPTPTPVTSPYDGNWSGTVTGKTEGGSRDYTGSFRMEVRNGAVYRISTDGASCIFDHYPNFPKGTPINGNSFFAGGQVFHPQDSSTAGIGINIGGTFTSANRVSGTINATQGGGSCISGSWSAAKQ